MYKGELMYPAAVKTRKKMKKLKNWRKKEKRKKPGKGKKEKGKKENEKMIRHKNHIRGGD